MELIEKSFDRLLEYCEKEQFLGWDPYDGLNSKIFQKLLFINKSTLFRLFWIQGFKRSSINFRKILMVPKGYNPKGIALFLQGYCNLYKVIIHNSAKKDLMDAGLVIDQINYLATLLISLQSKGYRGACWGYNFDWQSKAFFLPKYTPTVVASSFAVEALCSAYEITKNEEYMHVAQSCADFILNDLNRIDKPQGFMFSYSPLDRKAVYNATLLGTKTLSLIYQYTKNIYHKEAAFLSALATCNEQNGDGSFPHSDQVRNNWHDNFHTGFKLESLSIFERYCQDHSFVSNVERGYTYWINNFFDANTGIAKYYDTGCNNIIDLHCVAQAIPTLFKLNKLEEQKVLGEKILKWAIVNMQSHRGYFYFQKNESKINKIAYMRWPNAWMFYGMSYWFLQNIINENN